MSDWLRQAVGPGAVQVTDYRRPQPRRRFSQVDPSLLLAIARLGNNCNQIAHVLNAHALRAERVDTLRCLHVLREIQREISALAKAPAPAAAEA